MTSPSPGRRFANVEGHRSARAPRRGSTPLVSVVVASNGDSQRLASCLPTIVDECARTRTEVVVARAAMGSDIDTFVRSYPTVGFVEGPATASIAQLRAIGMREAVGDIVVFVEDVTEFDAERLAACVRESQHDGEAPTGENGRRVEIDWVACLARCGVRATVAGSSGVGHADAAGTPQPHQMDGTESTSRLRRWLSGVGRMFRGTRRS